MPLVGGNELSFFSISFTICFYLVINESSVWWQQAAGCLLAAALGSHKACQTSLCFLHAHVQMQPGVHAHNRTHVEKHTKCTDRSVQDAAAAEARKPTLSHIFSRTAPSIILMVLLSPEKYFPDYI